MKEYLKQCKGEDVRDRQGAEEDCGRIFTAIEDILGDDLTDDLQQELDQLREKCPFCVDTFIKTLEKSVDVCRQLPDQPLSDQDRTDLRQKVLAGLAEIRHDIDNC